MSDQDLDGYHIKLLFMQMLRARFPDLLLKYPEYVQCFVTPIVTATPNKKGEEKLLFFSLQDFEKWKQENARRAALEPPQRQTSPPPTPAKVAEHGANGGSHP